MIENPIQRPHTEETANCATSTITLQKDQTLLTDGRYMVPLQKDWKSVGINGCSLNTRYVISEKLNPIAIEYARTQGMPEPDCSMTGDGGVKTISCISPLAPPGEQILMIDLKVAPTEPGDRIVQIYDSSSNVTALGNVEVLKVNSKSYLPTIKADTTTLFTWGSRDANFVIAPEAQITTTEISLVAQELLTNTNQFTATPPVYDPQIESPIQ